MRSLFICAFVVLSAFVYSCRKSNAGPSVDDNILNYKIDEIPVTQDYVVGSFYTNFTAFNPNVPLTPVVGKYGMSNGVVDPTVMTQQIADAGKAKLDFFVFSFRSFNLDYNNFKFDSTVIQSFLNVNGSMKFALSYTWDAGKYGLTTATPLEGNPTKLAQFLDDVQRLSGLFSNSNYMKVGGKILLLIRNAQVLYSNDNPSIYKSLRDQLSAKGFQAYIVGMQDAWTPPARYPFRFKGCVDAIYHDSYSKVSSWDRYYLLPQTMDQAWIYSKKYFSDNYSVDYIPNISPAFNPKINNPTTTNPVFPRGDTGVALFKTLCNVAKKNVSTTTRLVLIDSFNDWANGTELEPATTYGDTYLNIVKSEFKK